MKCGAHACFLFFLFGYFRSIIRLRNVNDVGHGQNPRKKTPAGLPPGYLCLRFAPPSLLLRLCFSVFALRLLFTDLRSRFSAKAEDLWCEFRSIDPGALFAQRYLLQHVGLYEDLALRGI